MCVCTVLAGCVEFTKLGYSKGVRPAGKMLTKPFKIKKQFPQILNSCGLWGRRQLRLRQRDWVLSVHGVSVRSSSEAIVAKWFCDSIQIRCCLCRPFQCSDYFFHITTGRARLWSQGPGRCERWGQAGPCGGGSGRSAPGSPASPRASRGGAETTQPHFPGEKQTAGWGGEWVGLRAGGLWLGAAPEGRVLLKHRPWQVPSQQLCLPLARLCLGVPLGCLRHLLWGFQQVSQQH